MEITEGQWRRLNEWSKNLMPLNASYRLSYSAFIKFFDERESITKQDVIIGANFTYGWMPRVLRIYTNNLEEQIVILNRLKNDKIIPSEVELKTLMSVFNRSIVGTSKLMHFISPNLIPIWDSKVHKRIKEIVKMNYSTNTINNYKTYLLFCQSVTNDSRFIDLRKRVTDIEGDSISNMRAIEQLLFLTNPKY